MEEEIVKEKAVGKDTRKIFEKIRPYSTQHMSHERYMGSGASKRELGRWVKNNQNGNVPTLVKNLKNHFGKIQVFERRKEGRQNIRGGEEVEKEREKIGTSSKRVRVICINTGIKQVVPSGKVRRR